MEVTARDRRTILKLLNVSEAARSLDVPMRQMYFDIKAGWIPKPEIRLGKRLYHHADDLRIIAERYAAIKNHP